MTRTKEYDGIPFFIKTGTTISKDKLPEVQNAIRMRLRNTDIWRDRCMKGEEIQKAMRSREAGAVQNINMMYAYNAYQKFLTQSLLSLKDTFRISTNNYRIDVERPTEILRNYLSGLQFENSLLADDSITYGCAALLLDVDITEQVPKVLLNRVQSKYLIYDFEQPGSMVFTIRITPEIAYKLDFLTDTQRKVLYNKASASAENVANIRVFVGELVVDNELSNYIAIIYKQQVYYAEKNRNFTIAKAVSIYDKNNDFSPIYTVLKASEISRDNLQMILDYNNEIVNPIKTGPYNLSATAWQEAQRTRWLKLPAVGNPIQSILPGELDVNGLVSIQQQLQTLAQQAAGLNDYTLGEATGSVRTYGEAMMLADSASGIMNILANKLKQKLILPMLQEILEILKLATEGISDIFDNSLYIDTDIIKDQQESNLLMSMINMPMFGSIVQGMDSVQALQLFRWILEKMHISGTESIFSTLISSAANNQQQQIINNNNKINFDI